MLLLDDWKALQDKLPDAPEVVRGRATTWTACISNQLHTIEVPL